MAEVAVPTPDGVPVTTHSDREESNENNNGQLARSHETINDSKELEATSPPTIPAPETPPKPEYPTPLPLTVILVSLMLAMFLVALDMSIIATAIPRITNDFHSLQDVGWYGSAFFLTLAAFTSFWGKAFAHLDKKWVFLAAVFVFEVGSLICAVSPNSKALIIGRAIQGAGGAGVTGGVYTILAFIVPPPKVATYMGLVGALYSLASVIGPLLGGVFTQRLTWRWCFYVNLPIGGAAFLTLLLFFKPPLHAKSVPIPFRELLLRLDFPGMMLLTGSLICFSLALEWAGITKSWASADVIGTLIGWAVLTIVFAIIEWKQGERALVVPRILKRRNIAVLSVFIFCINASSFARSYNMPIYFQAIDGVSPSESGIRVLPTILSVCLFTFIGAGAVGKIGWYQPFLLLGSALAIIGGSLIYTFDIGTGPAKFIGYQVIAGTGVGLMIQVPIVVAQATSSRADVTVAMSIVLFFQFVGSAIGLATGQNILDELLLNSLPTHAPSVSPQNVLSVGAYNLGGTFNPIELLGVRRSYIIGLRGAWAFSVALTGFTFVVGFLGVWRNFKPKVVVPPAVEVEKRRVGEVVG